MLPSRETIKIYGDGDNKLTIESDKIEGSSKYHAYSFDENMKIDDDEFMCIKAERTWQNGSMNRSDWGSPGMNHKTVDRWSD